MSKGKSIEEAIGEVMAETGMEFEVVRGSDKLLTIDLDDARAIAVYEENFNIFQQYLVVEEVGRWPSKSGLGEHRIVKLSKPMDSQARAGLQAMLGSDPTRELLGWLNANQRDEEPFCLFKPKEKK